MPFYDSFVEEIQQDSARAAAYLEIRPTVIAGLDSLIAFVDGSTPPDNLVATLLFTSSEFALPPVVAWSEIQASNSLDLIGDPEVRAVLTSYYASRDRSVLMWSRQDSRGRDPLWDELYRTGILDPEEGPGGPAAEALDVFRSWPGIRQLLVAVRIGHFFQGYEAANMLEAASTSLKTLRAVN